MSSRLSLIVACLVVVLTGALVCVAAPVPKTKGRRLSEGPLGMKFAFLPKGTTYLGWNDEPGSAKKTEIKENFEIAIHPVTQGQWTELMGTNPSSFSRDGKNQGKVKDIGDEELKEFPVEDVSWDDCQNFIDVLNNKEKGKGWVYRFPSGAEWEYACRGGATTEEECSFHYYLDKPTNGLSTNDANYGGGDAAWDVAKGPTPLGRPTKVGSYRPNKLGLYDMHGNVSQWTNDREEVDSGKRTLRGSCWFGHRGIAEARYQAPLQSSDIRWDMTGLRLVRVRSAPER